MTETRIHVGDVAADFLQRSPIGDAAIERDKQPHEIDIRFQVIFHHDGQPRIQPRAELELTQTVPIVRTQIQVKLTDEFFFLLNVLRLEDAADDMGKHPIATMEKDVLHSIVIVGQK